MDDNQSVRLLGRTSHHLVHVQYVLRNNPSYFLFFHVISLICVCMMWIHLNVAPLALFVPPFFSWTRLSPSELVFLFRDEKENRRPSIPSNHCSHPIPSTASARRTCHNSQLHQWARDPRTDADTAMDGWDGWHGAVNSEREISNGIRSRPLTDPLRPLVTQPLLCSATQTHHTLPHHHHRLPSPPCAPL